MVYRVKNAWIGRIYMRGSSFSLLFLLSRRPIVGILIVPANSWVGQNCRSIELYFLLSLKWTVVVSQEEFKWRKRRKRRNSEDAHEAWSVGLDDRSIGCGWPDHSDASPDRLVLGKFPKWSAQFVSFWVPILKYKFRAI